MSDCHIWEKPIFDYSLFIKDSTIYIQWSITLSLLMCTFASRRKNVCFHLLNRSPFKPFVLEMCNKPSCALRIIFLKCFVPDIPINSRTSLRSKIVLRSSPRRCAPNILFFNLKPLGRYILLFENYFENIASKNSCNNTF